MADSEEEKREMGWIKATLDGITGRLVRMESKLDEMNIWQRSTDARLAAGSEKFNQLEGRDRTFGILNAVGAAIGVTLAGWWGTKR